MICPYCQSEAHGTPVTKALGGEVLRCPDCRREYGEDSAERAQPPAVEEKTADTVEAKPQTPKKRKQ